MAQKDSEQRDDRLLKAIAACLEPQESAIITMRFGLDGEAGCTLPEAAARLGISQAQAHRLQQRAVRKVKLAMEEDCGQFS